MKPAKFEYHAPASVDEALAILGRYDGEARVLAGGQSLVPMMNFRLARPTAIVDLNRIDGLAYVEEEGVIVRIGSMTRQRRLEFDPLVAAKLPLLREALRWVGHLPTRSRGTIGGSIAHADPSAEIPLVLLALAGEIVLSSRRGSRRLAAADFFTGLMSTAREENELIEAAIVPRRRPGHGYAFREFARRHGDFAIVACAAIANEREARLAIGGVADRPVAFDGLPLDGAALAEALDHIAGELAAREDLHATPEYRRELVRRLGRATIAEARQCRA